MSGTPGSDPDARYPSWVVNPWDGVYMDVLDYQWDVATKFWTEIDALARANDRGGHRDAPAQPGVLPGHLKKLVDLVGATNIGAEIDPSHLMWQGMDVVACIRWLGPLVFGRGQGRDDLPDRGHPGRAGHLVHPGAGGCGEQGPDRLRVLGQRVAGRAGLEVRRGRYRARRRVLDRVPPRAGRGRPGLAVNIEHEDADYCRLEGLALAAENLLAAAAKI